jgi:hypothetical protein
MVTPTSPSEMSLTNRVRRSDIVILKLVNPSENTLVTVGTLITPVILSISVIGDVNTTAYGLQVYCNTTYILFRIPIVISDRFLKLDPVGMSSVSILLVSHPVKKQNTNRK